MKRKTERQRWVRLYTFSLSKASNPEWSASVYDKAFTIVEAFGKIGRVVRVETDGNMLVLRARR